jgi:hypothetical protein
LKKVDLADRETEERDEAGRRRSGNTFPVGLYLYFWFIRQYKLESNRKTPTAVV